MELMMEESPMHASVRRTWWTSRRATPACAKVTVGHLDCQHIAVLTVLLGLLTVGAAHAQARRNS